MEGPAKKIKNPVRIKGGFPMDGQCGKCPMIKRLCADPQMEKGPEYCSTLLYGEALEKADRLYA